MRGDRDKTAPDRTVGISSGRESNQARGHGLLERTGCDHLNWEDFCGKNPGAKIYMATTKGRHVYTEVSYEPDCYIMFGKESAGIPEEILKANPDTCVRIPMIGETRSLNLSNSVAIVLYEALRQNEFDHMKLQGELHRLRWED
jgi:tRNA (cytidine/uridine-2'-O-)-methyltransferase